MDRLNVVLNGLVTLIGRFACDQPAVARLVDSSSSSTFIRIVARLLKHKFITAGLASACMRAVVALITARPAAFGVRTMSRTAVVASVIIALAKGSGLLRVRSRPPDCATGGSPFAPASSSTLDVHVCTG